MADLPGHSSLPATSAHTEGLCCSRSEGSVLSPGCLTGSGVSYGCRGELVLHQEDSGHQEQEAWVFHLATSGVNWVPGMVPPPGCISSAFVRKEARSRTLCVEQEGSDAGSG